MASSGEERPAPAEEKGLGFQEERRKKRRGDIKRAAEIVLALNTMNELRSGPEPTAVERELMAEAHGLVACLCGDFAPKNLFPPEICNSAMKDMGLISVKNMLRCQSSKVSIAELVEKKRKSFEASSGVAAKSHGAVDATAAPPFDKTSHPTFPTGKVHSTLPASRVSKPSYNSSGHPTGLLGRDSSIPAVPRVDRPHFRPDSRLNGPSFTPPINVDSFGGQAPQKSSVFVQQVQSSLPDKSRPHNKVISHPSARVEGPTVGTTRVPSQAFKPSPTQTTAGHSSTMPQHVQGMDLAQRPSSNPYTKTSIIVQKLLRPHIPKLPMQTLPPRGFMNKSTPCQVCEVTIKEVENALVCDACEKGYHIKCIGSHNQIGVLKCEWHCFNCLSSSNRKPLPIKYGRVAGKRDSSTAAVQSSQEMIVEKSGENKNKRRIISKGSSGLQSPTENMGNSDTNSEIVFNPPIWREAQENDILSKRGDIDDERRLDNCSDDATKWSGSGCTSVSVGLSDERAHVKKSVSEIKGQPLIKTLKTGSEMMEVPSNLSCKGQEVLPDKEGVSRPDDQRIVRSEPTVVSRDTIMVGVQMSVLSDISGNVDWIGDVLKVSNEKIYYPSCCVNGVVYKVHGHALLPTCNRAQKLTPFKLQAMWEDSNTRCKWVTAHKCYFRDDLPQAVGHPLPFESNEVCESNHGITIMAGLIRGPCEVLPPVNFAEKSQRRSHLRSGEKDGLGPLFLCKWYFDQPKGSFSDVSI